VIAERVAADWAALGVTLVISELDAAAIAARVRRGNFDLALTEASVPVADAVALLSRWRCTAGLVCDAAADALLDKARAASPLEQSALLAAAEAQWLKAPPMVPLLTPVRWALVARGVKGWTANSAGSHPLGRMTVAAKP
jgi:ABC-type oligopeptide transport system substrate-binding subunit